MSELTHNTDTDPVAEDRTFGDWVRRQREVRNWPKAELARRVGVTGPMIGLIERGRNQPGEDLRKKLLTIFGEQTDEADVELQFIYNPPDSLIHPTPERIRVGIAGTWDAALYMGCEPLLFMNDIDCDFDLLPGWGPDPLEHLEEGRYQALVHNRFLLASAWRQDRVLDVRMVAPLYTYRGQFVFVSRQHTLRVRERYPDGSKEHLELTALLNSEYDLKGNELVFPRVADSGRRALLENARFAYVPGTDLEEMLRQVYDDLFDSEESKSSWASENRRISDNERHFRQGTAFRRGGLIGDLFCEFKKDNYDVFCGGLAHLWAAAEDVEESGEWARKPRLLTICNPKEFNTPSLNGLIARESTVLTRGKALNLIAESFYVGAQLFKKWYRSLPPTWNERDKSASTERSVSQMMNLFRLADQAKPIDDEPTRTSYDRTDARAWARLMFRYVDLFESPSEASAARVDPNAREFVRKVSMLAEHVSKGR